jgi:Beta-galactosidase
VLTALLASAPVGAAAGESNIVRVQFREVDTLFANPGQGWMSQQRSPRGEPRFPCSVLYIRFNWADAEPEEGNFNWKLIDDVIAAWKPRGAAVALRVMTCNAQRRPWCLALDTPEHEGRYQVSKVKVE